jgi:hypothetical protein
MDNTRIYGVSYLLWFSRSSLDTRKRGDFKQEIPEGVHLKAEDILLGIASREPDIKKVVYGVYSVIPITGGQETQALIEFSESQLSAIIKHQEQNTGTLAEEYNPEYQAGVIATNTNYQLILGNQQIQYEEALEVFIDNRWVAGKAQRDRKGKWAFKPDEGELTDFKVGTKARRHKDTHL